jgi:hypothetical protein
MSEKQPSRYKINKELKANLATSLAFELKLKQREFYQNRYELVKRQTAQRELKQRIAGMQQLIWELKK